MRQSSLPIAHLPSPVRQNDFSPAKGNALQACVAALFNQKLGEVPNFIELECGYEQGIRDYLSSTTTGISLRKLGLGDGHSLLLEKKGKLCIVRGKSPRGDFGHVVLARVSNGGFEMVHDPHPDDTFLDETEAYGWCMFFD